MANYFNKLVFGSGIGVEDDGDGTVTISEGGGSEGAIMFDTQPQEGGFLYITTDEAQGGDATGNFIIETIGASGPTVAGKFVVDATGDVLIDSGADASLTGAGASLNGGAD